MGGECGLFNMLGKQCQGSDSGKSQDYTDDDVDDNDGDDVGDGDEEREDPRHTIQS